MFQYTNLYTLQRETLVAEKIGEFVATHVGGIKFGEFSHPHAD